MTTGVPDGAKPLSAIGSLAHSGSIALPFPNTLTGSSSLFHNITSAFNVFSLLGTQQATQHNENAQCCLLLHPAELAISSQSLLPLLQNQISALGLSKGAQPQPEGEKASMTLQDAGFKASGRFQCLSCSIQPPGSVRSGQTLLAKLLPSYVHKRIINNSCTFVSWVEGDF